MKKLLAVLLCLLLTCTTAFSLAQGQALRSECIWNADAEGTSAWLQNLGVAREQADVLGNAAAQLMNVLSISSVCNLDGSAANASLALKGWEALSADLNLNDDGLTVLLSCLPSYALTLSRDSLVGPVTGTLTALPGQLLSAISDWAEALPASQQTGTFDAAAYTCTRRTVIGLTDRDLSALADRLLQVLPGSDSVAASALGFISSLGEANEGRIRLVIGRDDEGEPVGFSITAGTASETLLTLSCSLDSDSPALVAGFAWQGFTWFMDMTLASEQNDTLSLSGSLRRLQGSATYNAVKARGETVLTMSCRITADSSCLNMINSLEMANGGVLGEELSFSFSGSSAELNLKVTSGSDKKPAWSFIVSASLTDAISPVDPGTRKTADLRTAAGVPAIISELYTQLMSNGYELLLRLPTPVLELLRIN